MFFESWVANVSKVTCTGTNGIVSGWAHYAVTISSTSCVIYVNGSAITTTIGGTLGSGSLPATVQRTNAYLGKSNWVADSYFEKSIGRVSMWNRALTAAEISSRATADTPNPQLVLSSSTVAATVGSAITSITPTIYAAGTNSPSSYSISPSLPTGLSINSSTGVISGTPTVTSTSTTYTVTANGLSPAPTATFSLSSDYAACSVTPVTANGYTVYKFINTGNCNWSVPSGITKADVLVVAGGGAGSRGRCGYNYGAGGGGGEVIYQNGLTISGTVTITVGAGGEKSGTDCSANNTGTDGGTSSFGTYSAAGGKASAWNSTTGGASGNGKAGATINTSPYGCATYDCGAGGGGGSGAAGSSFNGGAGTSSAITGTTVYYGVGGPGRAGSTLGSSGNSLYSVNQTPTANSGGGGSDWTAGAAGVVIVKYVSAANTPTFTGVTTSTTGFTATISNYDANYEYTLSATNGASVSNSGSTITVTGLTAGQSTTVTVTTSANGFTGSATVSATANLTITYANGGGSGSGPTSPVTVAYGSTFTTPANTFTRAGYQFSGWKDAANNTYAAGATYPSSGSVSADVTLTAQWTNCASGVVQSGLLMHLDAGSPCSTSGGTTWLDISGNSNNGTFSSTPTFVTDRGYYYTFATGKNPQLPAGFANFTLGISVSFFANIGSSV